MTENERQKNYCYFGISILLILLKDTKKKLEAENMWQMPAYPSVNLKSRNEFTQIDIIVRRIFLTITFNNRLLSLMKSVAC